jgi:hypothetical protein
MKVRAVAPAKSGLSYGVVHLRSTSGSPACSPRRFTNPVVMTVDASDIECRQCSHILTVSWSQWDAEVSP